MADTFFGFDTSAPVSKFQLFVIKKLSVSFEVRVFVRLNARVNCV